MAGEMPDLPDDLVFPAGRREEPPAAPRMHAPGQNLPDDVEEQLPDDLVRPGGAPQEEGSWLSRMWERGRIDPESVPRGFLPAELRTAPHYENMLRAFGHGFSQQWDADTFGLSREAVDALRKFDLLPPEGTKSYRETGWKAPFYAFNELVAKSIWHAGQIGYRSYTGVYAGLQEAFPPLVVMDAFAGSPTLGIPRAQPKPWVRPSEIKPIDPVERPFGPAIVSRVEAAKTGVPHVDAVLNDPTTSSVIDSPVVDRSHTIPYTAGGSVPLSDPTFYIDHRFPEQITARRASDPARTITFDPAEPFAIHENVEQHVMEQLIEGGMDKASAYKVAHFEFAERAEGAWYALHDIDQAHAEELYQPHMDRIQRGAADNVPPNLYEDPYPHDTPSAARHEALAEPRPTPEEIASAKAILARSPNEVQTLMRSAAGRDAVAVAPIVVEGALADRPPGGAQKTELPRDRTYPIHDAAGRPVGDVELVESPNAVKVVKSEVAAESQGRGLGSAAYRRLAEDAIHRGKVFESDKHVSVPASKIYDRLEKQGFTVERNQTAKRYQDDTGDFGGVDYFETTDGSPVFRITAAPPPEVFPLQPGRVAEAPKTAEPLFARTTTLPAPRLPRTPTPGDYVGRIAAGSRTASGEGVSAKGKPGKAAKVVEGLTPKQSAQLANQNLADVISDLYFERQAPVDAANIDALVQTVAERINEGIVKPGELQRTHETGHGQTAPEDLPIARQQFAEELAERLNDPKADPIETAAWIEWRANIRDHPWTDGVGKTSRALASFPLMRAGEPLPTYPTGRGFFKHAQNLERVDPRDGGKAYLGPEWRRFNDYYHDMVAESRRELHQERAEVQALIDREATPQEIEAHPLIARALKEAREYQPTNEMEGYGSPEWTQNRRVILGDREAVGWDAARDYLTEQARKSAGPGGVRNERRATIVIGPGGAGKSTIMEPLAAKRGAAIIDADEAKKVLLEFRDGIGAGAVHEESSDLMYKPGSPYDRLRREGANLMIQKIGHNPESITKLRDKLIADGYTVDLVNVSVDTELAFRRRMGRFLRTGRINPAGYRKMLDENGFKPRQTFLTLQKEGLLNETAQVDVNGQAPRLIKADPALAGDLGYQPIEQPGPRRGLGQGHDGDRGTAGEGAPGEAAPAGTVDGRVAISAAIDKIGERGNTWVSVPEGQIYLRAGQRPGIGKTLEVPNVEFNEEARGQGAFTRYLDHIEQEAGERGFDAVYAEQLFNTRLEKFLRGRGYQDEPSAIFGFGGGPATLYKSVQSSREFMAEEPYRLSNGKAELTKVEADAANVLESNGNDHGRALREVDEHLQMKERFRPSAAQPMVAEPRKAKNGPGWEVWDKTNNKRLVSAEGGLSKEDAIYYAQTRTERNVEAVREAPGVAAEHTASVAKWTAVRDTLEQWQEDGTQLAGRMVTEEEQAEPTRNPLLDARDLGVIGREPKPVGEGAPAEVAARSGSGGDTPPPEPPKPPGGGEPPAPGRPPSDDNAWRARFEHFVSRLTAPEDVKQLIRDAAKEGDAFMPARQGEIPLRDLSDIADAAGVDPRSVDPRGLGRLLRNDAEVRAGMRVMLQATENVKAAAIDVAAEASPANLMKLQEAMLRRDMAVEQVVGQRAEWGRTGNVFQEFMERVKGEEDLSKFLSEQGRKPEDLQKLARAITDLDNGKAAQLLSNANKPGFWDKFLWYWVNALISGPITHTKYIVANATFAAYESAVVTPVAGVIGTARRAISGSREGVYVGEAMARVWGIVAGTPDALVAAAKAARTGLQTPLPGEVAQNIIPKQNRTLAFQQRPIGGVAGTIVGLPSRGASAIHSFFNFLGYRASIEAQGYRQAAQSNMPHEQAFWDSRQRAVDNPSVDMMNTANAEGYRLTYISDVGQAAQKIGEAIRATKVGQLVMPFLHIPFNILARGAEGTPIGLLSPKVRADLMGRNGAVAQDTAVARMIAGSAVGAWGVSMVANDRMSGFGPTDPKERAQWLATGHQPYSIRIGDYWYSFNRFGSIGTMLGIYANLGEAIPHMKPDDEELTKALTMTVKATGRLLEDEVGMQGLAGLMEAINEPERKGQRFVSSFVASFLPYSSFLRQTASAFDAEMREVKSVVDGLRYHIPVARQGLLPKRDWLGESVLNPGYGGDIPYAPGVSAVIQHHPAEPDPLGVEMKLLDLHPTPPANRIGGVQLPPRLYDEYQVKAGALTRPMLEHFINQPGWDEMPRFVREELFRKSITQSHQSAAALMQVEHPELIQVGVENKMRRIRGEPAQKMAPQLSDMPGRDRNFDLRESLSMSPSMNELGKRINPEAWERMLEESPASENIEDRRTPPHKARRH